MALSIHSPAFSNLPADLIRLLYTNQLVYVIIGSQVNSSRVGNISLCVGMVWTTSSCELGVNDSILYLSMCCGRADHSLWPTVREAKEGVNFRRKSRHWNHHQSEVYWQTSREEAQVSHSYSARPNPSCPLCFSNQMFKVTLHHTRTRSTQTSVLKEEKDETKPRGNTEA